MNLLLRVAWRNIWRNPRRSILTMSAIGFAAGLLTVMLGIQEGSYGDMINNAVKLHTGHLQIQHPEYLQDRRMTLTIDNRDAIYELVANNPGVSAYSSRVNTAALVSAEDNTFAAMLMGVDPEREATVSTVKNMVKKGDYLSTADPTGALLGEILARNLGVDVGQEFVFMGQGADGSIAAARLTVRGIFSMGFSDIDKSGLFIPLLTAQQEFMLEGRVHEVVLLVDDFKAIDDIKRQINAELKLRGYESLVALSWDEVTPGLKQAIQLDAISGYIFFFILLLIVAFGILNTVLMAFFERMREFGALLAMGASRTQLQKLIFLETWFMALTAVLIGCILGATGSLILQRYGIAFSGADEVMKEYGMSPVIHARFSILHVLVAMLVVLSVTSITSLSPIIKIGKINPVKALRYV